MGERVDDDPPSSKQVLVELDFVPADEPEMMRTRGLLIPSLRGARDVLHLEAALWALAKSDPDLQRRIREQEQIFFSSNLNFVFFGDFDIHVARTAFLLKCAFLNSLQERKWELVQAREGSSDHHSGVDSPQGQAGEAQPEGGCQGTRDDASAHAIQTAEEKAVGRRA